MGMRALRGHRDHANERRSKRMTVAFNSAELLLVEAAAARDGLRPGAWVGAAATAAAQRPVDSVSHAQRHPELEGLRTELLGLRRLSGNIAGNINDLARHANSTGEVKPEAEAVLAYVRTLAKRMDRVIDDIRDLTR